MCKVLKISRSLIYYSKSEKGTDLKLEKKIKKIFINSRNNYGTRKIKKELDKKFFKTSRRKIGRIMKKYGLVSNYTVKQYKVHKSKCNEENVENIVDRDFDRDDQLEVVVSDLTYVNVAGSWNYICVIIDLFNREIIGYSAGKNKDADLVHKAFSGINKSLDKIRIFHTDRGSEFKNNIIDDLLSTFKVTRSLSKKGCPYDNAVAEATFKIIKTEFVHQYRFESLDDLQKLLFDYVNWYNNIRIHGSLDYLTPMGYRMRMSEKKLS